MGLTWCDEPRRSVVDLTGGRDRIIDLRTPADRRRRPHPDRVEMAAIRWTVFGVRCSIEVLRRDDCSAPGEPRVVPSEA